MLNNKGFVDPVIIPITIVIVTLSALWLKDETVSINHCKNGTRFKVGDSVYRCVEEQRLMYRYRKMTPYGPMDCEGDECE